MWGSDCFVHQRKELRAGAMAAKSEPGIYLGHREDLKASVVWILRTGKRVHTRDIRYHDGRFRHMRALVLGDEEIEAVLDGSSELLGPLGDSDPEPDGLQTQKEGAATAV